MRSIQRDVLSAAMAICLCFTGLGVVATGGDVSARFGEAGLTSLSIGDTDILLPDHGFRATRVRFGGEEVNADNILEVGRDFDPASKTVTISYPWGRVSCRYSEVPGSLKLSVSIKNDTQKPMSVVDLELFSAVFPRTPKGMPFEKGFDMVWPNIDSIHHIIADFGEGRLALCTDTLDRHISFGLRPLHGKGPDRYAAVMSNNVFGTSDNPVVPPGKTASYEFSVRALKPDQSLADFAPDLVDKFRKLHPFANNWKDRRPIAMMMLASHSHKSEKNPRGWFNEPDLDVSGEGGNALFRKTLVERAHEHVKILRKINAQGFIFWNIEGEENPHPVTYIGDPRLVGKLAPEMDAAADEYFKFLSNEGFRTGVCIRPSKLMPSTKEPGKYWHKHIGVDPVKSLCEKISYAKKRWGCSIFYIDTNVSMGVDEEGKEKSWIFGVEVIKKVLKEHPDVLLIPEFGRDAYWAYCAPYLEMRPTEWGGHTGTPRKVLEIYPQAFSAINTNDGNEEMRQQLIESARHGEIFIFRGWFSDPANSTIGEILEQAGISGK